MPRRKSKKKVIIGVIVSVVVIISLVIFFQQGNIKIPSFSFASLPTELSAPSSGCVAKTPINVPGVAGGLNYICDVSKTSSVCDVFGWVLANNKVPYPIVKYRTNVIEASTNSQSNYIKCDSNTWIQFDPTSPNNPSLLKTYKCSSAPSQEYMSDPTCGFLAAGIPASVISIENYNIYKNSGSDKYTMCVPKTIGTDVYRAIIFDVSSDTSIYKLEPIPGWSEKEMTVDSEATYKTTLNYCSSTGYSECNTNSIIDPKESEKKLYYTNQYTRLGNGASLSFKPQKANKAYYDGSESGQYGLVVKKWDCQCQNSCEFGAKYGFPQTDITTYKAGASSTSYVDSQSERDALCQNRIPSGYTFTSASSYTTQSTTMVWWIVKKSGVIYNDYNTQVGYYITCTYSTNNYHFFKYCNSKDANNCPTLSSTKSACPESPNSQVCRLDNFNSTTNFGTGKCACVDINNPGDCNPGTIKCIDNLHYKSCNAGNNNAYNTLSQETETSPTGYCDMNTNLMTCPPVNNQNYCVIGTSVTYNSTTIKRCVADASSNYCSKWKYETCGVDKKPDATNVNFVECVCDTSNGCTYEGQTKCEGGSNKYKKCIKNPESGCLNWDTNNGIYYQWGIDQRCDDTSITGYTTCNDNSECTDNKVTNDNKCEYPDKTNNLCCYNKDDCVNKYGFPAGKKICSNGYCVDSPKYCDLTDTSKCTSYETCDYSNNVCRCKTEEDGGINNNFCPAGKTPSSRWCDINSLPSSKYYYCTPDPNQGYCLVKYFQNCELGKNEQCTTGANGIIGCNCVNPCKSGEKQCIETSNNNDFKQCVSYGTTANGNTCYHWDESTPIDCTSYKGGVAAKCNSSVATNTDVCIKCDDGNTCTTNKIIGNTCSYSDPQGQICCESTPDCGSSDYNCVEDKCEPIASSCLNDDSLCTYPKVCRTQINGNPSTCECPLTPTNGITWCQGGEVGNSRCVDSKNIKTCNMYSSTLCSEWKSTNCENTFGKGSYCLEDVATQATCGCKDDGVYCKKSTFTDWCKNSTTRVTCDDINFNPCAKRVEQSCAEGQICSNGACTYTSSGDYCTPSEENAISCVDADNYKKCELKYSNGQPVYKKISYPVPTGKECKNNIITYKLNDAYCNNETLKYCPSTTKESYCSYQGTSLDYYLWKTEDCKAYEQCIVRSCECITGDEKSAVYCSKALQYSPDNIEGLGTRCGLDGKTPQKCLLDSNTGCYTWQNDESCGEDYICEKKSPAMCVIAYEIRLDVNKVIGVGETAQAAVTLDPGFKQDIQGSQVVFYLYEPGKTCPNDCVDRKEGIYIGATGTPNVTFSTILNSPKDYTIRADITGKITKSLYKNISVRPRIKLSLSQSGQGSVGEKIEVKIVASDISTGKIITPTSLIAVVKQGETNLPETHTANSVIFTASSPGFVNVFVRAEYTDSAAKITYIGSSDAIDIDVQKANVAVDAYIAGKIIDSVEKDASGNYIVGTGSQKIEFKVSKINKAYKVNKQNFVMVEPSYAKTPITFNEKCTDTECTYTSYYNFKEASRQFKLEGTLESFTDEPITIALGFTTVGGGTDIIKPPTETDYTMVIVIVVLVVLVGIGAIFLFRKKKR